jgi:hypothetical protein
MRRHLPLICLLLAACSSSPGAVPPKAPGAQDPALLARAAVVLGSCFPDDGIDRNLANMWASDVNHRRLWNRTAVKADCLASAKSGCAALDTCLGLKASAGTAAAPPTCTGSRFSYCEQAAAGRFACLSIDCATVGLSCDTGEVCLEAAPPTCGTGGADCAVVGLTCGGNECVGSGAACGGGGSTTEGDLSPEGLACTGTMLDACVGGKRATIDCAKRGPGFSCQHAGDAYFCGLASDCVPGNTAGADDTPNTCEGNTVVLCNAGRVDRVDCTSLGFTGCEVDRAKAHYGCLPTLPL